MICKKPADPAVVRLAVQARKSGSEAAVGGDRLRVAYWNHHKSFLKAFWVFKDSTISRGFDPVSEWTSKVLTFYGELYCGEVKR